jgi:hypothetical protein
MKEKEKNTSRIFLIQGLFFTKDSMLAIRVDPEIGERVAIQTAITHTMYAGVLKFPEGINYAGVGALQDHYGVSDLSVVRMTKDSLTFVKKYSHRRDTIFYNLNPISAESNIWIGNYSGDDVGYGAVRCIITEISEDFFSPLGLEVNFKKMFD